MRVQVTSTVGDLANDLKGVATSSNRRLPNVVRDAAQRGNRNAQAFASEQHTMFSDVDADYAPSFSVERVGRLVYEYGPVDEGEGRKASGYEFGSINQAYPHRDLARSFEIEEREFPLDVSDELRLIFSEHGF